ncbi:MAG: B12-binding domain-containing radical SAM protein [Candidatus Pacebacteria bacterium]|nr:B12-binding domain-containing radical SAM protein [Candidatus Paceibacterota bacterium]
MADVVVIYPRTGLDKRGVTVTLPLAILSAASGLIGEFSVTVIDQRVTDNWEEVLLKELRQRPLCVALSSMTGTQIFYGLQISHFVKAFNPDIPILWGGMHATLMGEQTLRDRDIDFIIKGEGEIAFRDFVRELAGKRKFDKVAGLGWKDTHGALRINPEGPALDLNTLPPIPYHLVDIEEYTTPSYHQYDGVRRLLPFQGSRGCPFKCTFCSEPALTKVYRMLKPELFYTQTMELVQKYNLDHITFYDEEFFVNFRWATQVAELINGQYTWWVQSRANDLLKVDLKKMERCGMLIVAPGLESGSDRILKEIKKGETVAEYVIANKALAQTGIIPQYNFMMGFPTETQEDVNDTVDLALKLIEDNPRAVIHSFSAFTPLPGTELLATSVRDHGFKMPDTLEGWIGIVRRRLPTPWQQAKRELYENLMYTSMYISGQNKRVWLKMYWWAPSFLFDLYSRLVKWRWRKRKFKNTFDIKIARRQHKSVSPIDFEETFKPRG